MMKNLASSTMKFKELFEIEMHTYYKYKKQVKDEQGKGYVFFAKNIYAGKDVEKEVFKEAKRISKEMKSSHIVEIDKDEEVTTITIWKKPKVSKDKTIQKSSTSQKEASKTKNTQKEKKPDTSQSEKPQPTLEQEAKPQLEEKEIIPLQLVTAPPEIEKEIVTVEPEPEPEPEPKKFIYPQSEKILSSGTQVSQNNMKQYTGRHMITKKESTLLVNNDNDEYWVISSSGKKMKIERILFDTMYLDKKEVPFKLKQNKGNPEGGKKKLTEQDVLTIRREHKNGTPKARLARQYGVSNTCITNVVERNTWKHLA